MKIRVTFDVEINDAALRDQSPPHGDASALPNLLRQPPERWSWQTLVWAHRLGFAGEPVLVPPNEARGWPV